jgi:hypothetical protein
MSGKKRKPDGLCVYCGEIRPVTRDHVIPRTLFATPPPPNLITVPCCLECNNEKSKDDDYLRDILTADIYANAHPIARSIFEGKVIKSVRRNSSDFARVATTSARTNPIYTKRGVYLGSVISIAVDADRIKTIFTRVVRGLYYDARKQRVPDDYVFDIWRYQPWDVGEVVAHFNRLHPNGPRILGNIFGCMFLSAEEDPMTTFWLIWFYSGAFFSVSVENPALVPQLEDHQG